ncbi:MAG: DUF1501 domain-containing protein, partial [Planctomycetia bacterium]|nr:DUF1501 domain-containing protein [Planctomycetia bacterium]
MTMLGMNSYCDGLARRDVLRVGVAGLFGSGLPLANLLARKAIAADEGASQRDVSLIILFLKGGLSTIDTWDMKPDAPAEFRGPFQPIETNVPGIRIGEHLPQCARQADKFSLVRSFGHRNSDHGPADHYMLTGYHPLAGFNPTLSPNNQRPSHGSIIARKLGPRGPVPPYVCLPRFHASAGSAYLGASSAPLVVEADPNSPNFTVPDLTPPLVIRSDRLSARKELRSEIDRFKKSGETAGNKNAQAVDVFQQKAFELMTSSAARAAFDIHEEPEPLREA